jgi:hypothetical protein
VRYLTISTSQHRERASIAAACHAVLDVLAAACIVQPAIGRTRMTVAIAIPSIVIHCLVSTDASRNEILSSTTHQVALACLLAAFGDRSTPIRGNSFVGKAGGADRHEQSQCDEPEHLSLSMAATPFFYTTGQ